LPRLYLINMRVSLLSSRKKYFEGDAKRVMLPLEDGEMCVLDFHQPFVCALIAGTLRIERAWEGAGLTISIKRGLAKMLGNEVVLLIDT